MLYANKFCNPPLGPLPILFFFNQKTKKNCNFYFFHILLSWENIIGGNIIVILLAHTPITDCQINKSVKSVIKFSVYLDFLYSILVYCEICYDCVRESESVQERREREAKFSFELLIYYKFSQTDPIITGPRFCYHYTSLLHGPGLAVR